MQMGLVYLVVLVKLDILAPTGSARLLAGAAIFLRNYGVK